MTDRPEYTLLGTDDAMIWAEEFCRIFYGHMIFPNERLVAVKTAPIVDEGTMVGWFANAMQTAVNMYERRALTKKDETARVEEEIEESLEEGVYSVQNAEDDGDMG